MCKLSIITINFNNADGLKKTIESVISQDYKDFEYIIIDGGSTDASVDVIKEHEKHIAHWVSEKDRGVYDAMNKGVKLAKGEYLLMLNSGDYFAAPDILAAVFNDPAYVPTDIMYGKVLWNEDRKFREAVFPTELKFGHFRHSSIGHQSAFIKRELHDRVGLYDEKYKIVSDWKFFILAICHHNVSYRHLGKLISVCSRDGISCAPQYADLRLAERTEILQKEFPAFLEDYRKMDALAKQNKELDSFILFRIKRRLVKMVGRNKRPS